MIIFIFLLGLAVGSFLNVLIDRLPRGKSLWGRSHCDYCRKVLEPIDLIPVFSYLFLKGQCRRCKKGLSIKYPLIELLTGVVFVLVWLFIINGFWSHSVPQNDGIFHLSSWLVQDLILVAYLGLFTSLIGIFFIDLKHQIIPDELQITSLLFSILIVIASSGGGLQQIVNHVGDGIGVMTPILALYLVTRGRGMGFGDVKFAFVMGVLLGLWGGMIAVMSAFIFGAIAGVYLIMYGGKKLKSKIAFGPFLVFGLVFVLFFYDGILLVAERSFF